MAAEPGYQPTRRKAFGDVTSRAGSTSEVAAGEGILVELRNVIQESQESRAEAMQAETSLAAVLASVAARMNSCAHVTADQEVSVKTLADEMKSVADATQVLGSETGPVERRTDALFQVRFSTGAPTRLEEHSAALSFPARFTCVCCHEVWSGCC